MGWDEHHEGWMEWPSAKLGTKGKVNALINQLKTRKGELNRAISTLNNLKRTLPR